MRAFSIVFPIAIVISLLAGCGGSSPPPEPPSAMPEPAPAEAPASPPAEKSGDGQHTMPDGTVMPGEHHDHQHGK